MKSQLASVLVVAVDAKMFRSPKGLDSHGNKIQKGHPARRLQSLNKGVCNWLNKHSSKNSEARCERMSVMYQRFFDSFQREECGFYDPKIKRGGPNPDKTMRGFRKPKNIKAKVEKRERITRTRRQAIGAEQEKFLSSDVEVTLLDDDFDVLTDEDYENIDGCDGTEEGEMAEFCADDESDGPDARSRVTTINKRLKSVLSATMKWCNRFISECHGMRVHLKCVKRSKSLFAKFAQKRVKN